MQPLNFKKEGRIIGVLYLLMITTGIVGLSFRGLYGALPSQADFIDILRESATAMRLSVVLNFLSGLLVLSVGLRLRDLFKETDYAAPNWVFVIWVLQFGVAMVGDISHLILVDVATKPDLETTDLATLGTALVSGYFAGHWFGLILFGFGLIVLNIFHLRHGYLPKWLAVWGIIAPTLVIIATILQIFDVEVSGHFYNQNGVFIITYTFYHVIAGFSRPTKVRSIGDVA